MVIGRVSIYDRRKYKKEGPTEKVVLAQVSRREPGGGM